jgi:hypothetical protein
MKRDWLRNPWTWSGLVMLGMAISHGLRLKEGSSFLFGWGTAYFIWEICTQAPKSPRVEKEGTK